MNLASALKLLLSRRWCARPCHLLLSPLITTSRLAMPPTATNFSEHSCRCPAKEQVQQLEVKVDATY